MYFIYALFFFPFSYATVRAVLEGLKDVSTIVCLVIIWSAFIIAVVSDVWRALDDPLYGEVSFDSQGVTFYNKLHTIKFLYSDCVDIGCTYRFNPGIASKSRYVKFVYLSKMPLVTMQRDYLLAERSKRRRGKRNMPLYQSEYVLFECDADKFAEFLNYLPDRFRERFEEYY